MQTSPAPCPAADHVVRRLRDLARTSPELRVTARLYETILPLSHRSGISSSAFTLEASEMSRVLASGRPLLSAGLFEVDLEVVEGLVLDMLRAVEGMEPETETTSKWRFWRAPPEPWNSEEIADLEALRACAGNIRRAAEEGSLQLGPLLRCTANADRAGFSELVAAQRLDDKLLWTLMHQALKPLLHGLRSHLPSGLGASWDKELCFVCGSSATLGELQESGQVLHLRCTQCGADWHSSRSRCLHCGNRDRTTLKYLLIEGGGQRRVEVCERCGSYLKVITAFPPTEPELVLIEDLATLELDFIAQRRGYRRPAS